MQRANPDLRVEQIGGASASKAFDKALEDDFKRAETLSLPLTLIILLLAFGALVAAGLPLLLGMTAVGATLGLLGPISQLTPVADQIGSVVLLIGLAVGVDYSMFYVRREMEERDKGKGPQAALEAAAATSGHAIVVSGIIVLISMAGMLISGSSVFVSFGLGTMAVVAVAVVGSLTFLPAMLSWLGEKGWTEKGRVPILGRMRHRSGGQSRVWSWILDRVLARPWISASVSAALLLALAFPALGMHTMSAGIEGLPADVPVRGTYERVQAAFPGTTEPAEVVVQAADVTSPAVRAGIADLRVAGVATGHMSEPIDVRVNPDRTLAVVEIPLHGTGESDEALASLAALRDDVVPATIGKVPGTTVNISGDTAGSKDFNDTMKAHLPIVFGFVLGAAFLLLLFTFRSIVIPIKAIVLNLLSVGASYGVLTLVFQHGWGASLLGTEAIGGITSWLPLFLFVVLFGLSMDYHVFIISRIREAVLGGASTEDAVAERDQVDGRRRDERGARDDRRVLGLRDARGDRVQADGRRPGGRDPHRRDDRAGRAAAGDDEAARRVELVAAARAVVAAGGAGAAAGALVGVDLGPRGPRERVPHMDAFSGTPRPSTMRPQLSLQRVPTTTRGSTVNVCRSGLRSGAGRGPGPCSSRSPRSSRS